MHGRLTKLDAQLKEQMNRIIERRSDGLTFHYKAIDQVHADGQQLVNQAMGGILQDSINEMGAKAVLKGGGNPLQGILGSLGGLQTAIQDEWKTRRPISSSLVKTSAAGWSRLRIAASRWLAR